MARQSNKDRSMAYPSGGVRARLKYNEKLGGYELNVSDQELKGAPKHDSTSWNRDHDRKVFEYYGSPGYWV
jgi:hypothetical protein